jgi:hypothetical protein
MKTIWLIFLTTERKITFPNWLYISHEQIIIILLTMILSNLIFWLLYRKKIL